MGDKPKPWKEMSKKEKAGKTLAFIFCFALYGGFIGLMVYAFGVSHEKDHGPEIKLVSMDFAAAVNNDNTSHYGRDDSLVSARWDLLIRVPEEIVGDYMCLQGNLQASFLYKNVALVTSSTQSYNKLEAGMPHLLSISADASEKDLSGAIENEIMEAIIAKNEVRFGSRLSLMNCREVAKKGMMSYECDETTLRFESSSGSDGQIKAIAFGKRPICKIIS